MSKSLVLIVCFLAVATNAIKFPPKWKLCPKTNNEECLKEAIRDAMVILKNGNKELNVIPLDPLHFEKVVMDQGASSPVNINLTFINLDINGPSRIKVNWAKIDWDNYHMEIDADVLNGPAIISGDYSVSGKVLVLPINGKGKSNITFDNCSVRLVLNGTEQIKNNQKHFKVEKTGFYLRASRVHFYFENLFEGQKELGDNMNIFLNENWREIMNELNGTITTALGLGVTEVANNMFKKVPVTQLYT